MRYTKDSLKIEIAELNDSDESSDSNEVQSFMGSFKFVLKATAPLNIKHTYKQISVVLGKHSSTGVKWFEDELKVSILYTFILKLSAK